MAVGGDFGPKFCDRIVRSGFVGLPDEGHFLQSGQVLEVGELVGEQFRRHCPCEVGKHMGGVCDEFVIAQL